MYEGRTHLVRRLCDAIGHGAEKLQRIALGPLVLGRLELGTARVLRDAEIASLRRAVGLGRRASRPVRRPGGTRHGSRDRRAGR